MRKSLVVIALAIFMFGVVLAVLVRETRIEEDVIDEWNPIYPSVLYPHWDYEKNEFNVTGYAFISRAKGIPEKRAILEKALEVYLELNISASDEVRVRVGFISWDEGMPSQSSNPLYPPKHSMIAIFDDSGTKFDQRVMVQGANGTSADFLDIINEGTNVVNLSGSVKLVGKIEKTLYPLSILGIELCLLGFSLLIFGLLIKPKRKLAQKEGKKRRKVYKAP